MNEQLSDTGQPGPPNGEPPGSFAVLERKTTMERLELLARRGLLSLAGLERALVLAGYIPSAGMWRKFLDYALLVMGVVFSLSGVIFFFAFNWAAMSRFLKFGLVEAAIVACLGFAAYRGLNSLTGKAGLIAASVLVGALLAVQGQVYQTGANTYWLFLYWAVFITGWAIIAFSGPLWFLWLVLLNLTLWFYGEQLWSEDASQLNLQIILNGWGLLLWEVGHVRGVSWLQGRWEPRLIAVGAFLFAIIPPLILIFEQHFAGVDGSLILGGILYLILVAAVVLVYTRYIHDLFMPTLAAFSLIILITSAVGNEVAEADFEALGLLIVGLIIIVQAALAVNWLQRVARSWEVANG